jgi:hypothetical protein
VISLVGPPELRPGVIPLPEIEALIGPVPEQGPGTGGRDTFAAALYRGLHELDRQGLDWIAVEMPPAGRGPGGPPY